MDFSIKKNFYIVMLMLTVLIVNFSFILSPFGRSPVEGQNISQTAAVVKSQNKVSIISNKIPPPASLPPPQKLSNPPEIIKAVYVTGWSAGTRSYLNYLAKIFKTTEINAVVVDIKDYSGLVSYVSGAKESKKYNLSNKAIPDIDALVRFFHNQGIYVIGRISVFEDPAYSKARSDLAIFDQFKTIDLKNPILWLDNHKLSWLDPASKEVWDYNISLAKDAFLHGFDEINFDYIRFPSDGKIKNMSFPFWNGKTLKHKIIKEFFSHLRKELPDEKISADLFGQVTTNKDDMGIGQYLEDAFDYFDYISPMVYPSHYINGFMGFNNPAEYPYEVVKYSMESAIARRQAVLQKQKNAVSKNSEKVELPTGESANIISDIKPLAKFRPWLQDFDMGADYNADMVRQEIKAVEDALKKDYVGFMLWNPSNIYTQGAILKPETE